MRYSQTERLVRRQAKLRKCLLLKGGICQDCQKDLLTEPWDATFHHREGKETKVSEISQLIESAMDVVLIELDKCDLLCHTCHRKLHFNVRLFQEHYQEICERASLFDGVRFTKIDKPKLIELARLGVSSSKIAEITGRSERCIRRILRETGDRTNEKLIQTREEYAKSARRVTDQEILEARQAGMKCDEMTTKFGICSSVLNRRIKRLKKFGLIPPGKPKGYHKRTLGRELKKIYSYEEAQRVVQGLRILTRDEYRKRYKEDAMLPSNPEVVYTGQWSGWKDFSYERTAPQVAEGIAAGGSCREAEEADGVGSQ